MLFCDLDSTVVGICLLLLQLGIWSVSEYMRGRHFNSKIYSHACSNLNQMEYMSLNMMNPIPETAVVIYRVLMHGAISVALVSALHM